MKTNVAVYFKFLYFILAACCGNEPQHAYTGKQYSKCDLTHDV